LSGNCVRCSSRLLIAALMAKVIIDKTRTSQRECSIRADAATKRQRKEQQKKTTASGPPSGISTRQQVFRRIKARWGKRGGSSHHATPKIDGARSNSSVGHRPRQQPARHSDRSDGAQHQTAVARSSKNTSDGRAVQTKRRSLFQLSSGARAAYSSSARAAASRATEATIEAAEQRAFWSVFSDTLHSLLHSVDASTVSRAVSASVADS